MRGRVGLLGGTFDPPHSGHLIMAQTSLEVLGLERVILLPAPRPPHKSGNDLSSHSDRLEMASVASEGIDGVEVSNMESAHDGPSFTVDTLRACRDRYGSGLYFIMGADSLRDLPSWRDPESILNLCTLVVFPRDDIPARLEVSGDASLIVFESPRIDVSSTELRKQIARGEAVTDAIPGDVMAWIDGKGLYRRQ